jgi:hypothetical protein
VVNGREYFSQDFAQFNYGQTMELQTYKNTYLPGSHRLIRYDPANPAIIHAGDVSTTTLAGLGFGAVFSLTFSTLGGWFAFRMRKAVPGR